MSVEREMSRAVAVICVCATALVGASATAGPGYVEVAAAKSCKRPSGVGPGLTKGSGPTGWRADVMYVPSHENRSHGSSMGGKLRKYCNGTRFRYAFN